MDESLPPFPTQSPLALAGFVDAAHATDVKTRRSVTGWVSAFAGGDVACVKEPAAANTRRVLFSTIASKILVAILLAPSY
jgi:hypothetical protein